MVEYTIYIPSRLRSNNCFTARILLKEQINNFYIVVEPQDYNNYIKYYPEKNLLQIDKNNEGIAYIRNWIKNYSKNKKEEYHWQLDDNIRYFKKLEYKRVPSTAKYNLEEIEKFVKQYHNIAIAGMAYCTFAFGNIKEISVNKSPASGVLIKNNIKEMWRKGVPVDIDLSLQVLSKGYCTVVFNRLLIDKPTPLTMKGGCTEIEYGDGKRELRTLKLKELWPNLVNIKYSYGRPGLNIPSLKRTFKQNLIKKQLVV